MHRTMRDRSIFRYHFGDFTEPARSGRSSCDSRTRRARTRSAGIQARAWWSPSSDFGTSSFLAELARKARLTLDLRCNAQYSILPLPEGATPDLDDCCV